MRARWNSRWMWNVGLIALVLGAVLIVGAGTGVPVALAEKDDNNKHRHWNPFTQILTKLDEILDAITGGGAGGNGNHTLRWDTIHPAATRFIVLTDWSSQAVLDRETGLVWEQAPQTATLDWPDARLACIRKTVGGRMGWRLPSIPELASLVDPSVAFPGPTLPAGHPFTTVQSARYWSASTFAGDPASAWGMFFGGPIVITNRKADDNQVWCVRGGMNADTY